MKFFYWSEEDKKNLKRFYEGGTPMAEIVERFGRSAAAIKEMANNLGYKRPKKCAAHPFEHNTADFEYQIFSSLENAFRASQMLPNFIVTYTTIGIGMNANRSTDLVHIEFTLRNADKDTDALNALHTNNLPKRTVMYGIEGVRNQTVSYELLTLLAEGYINRETRVSVRVLDALSRAESDN